MGKRIGAAISRAVVVISLAAFTALIATVPADADATTGADDAVTAISSASIDVSEPVNDAATTLVPSVAPPSDGTVTQNTDDTLGLTTTPDNSGADQRTSQGCQPDGSATVDTTPGLPCSAASVAVAAQGPPVTADDAASTLRNADVTLAVLSNDSDPENGVLTVGTVTSPGHGTVANNGDGTITYTPAADYSGTDTFTYEACDPTALCTIGTATVTVVDVGPLTSSGPGPDPQSAAVALPAGAALTLLDASNNPVATLTIAAQGTYSSTADSLVFTPVPGVTGDATAAGYRVTTVGGASADSTYTPTVTLPDPPSPPDLESTGVGTDLESVTVIIPAGGQVELLTRSGAPAGTTYRDGFTFGLYTLDLATGLFTFTPDYGIVGPMFSPAGYRITDAYGQVGEALYTPNPSPPPGPTPGLLTSIGPSGQPQTASVTMPRASFEAHVSLLAAAASTTEVYTVAVAGQGSYTMDGLTGVITFTPDAGYAGTPDPVTYKVQDGYGTTGRNTYAPTVVGRPTPGPLVSTGAVTDPQQVTVQIPAGDTITLLDGDGNPADLVVTQQGSYTLDPIAGSITFTPLFGFAGVALPVIYRLTDTYHQTGDATYTPSVGTNGGPIAAAVSSEGVGTNPQTVIVDVPSGGAAALISGDQPVTSLNVPGQGEYTIDPVAGVITFVPERGYTGSHVVSYRVMDASGRSASATYTATVTPPPAPVVADLTTTGIISAVQTATVPIPAGGSVALLDGTTPTTAVKVTGQGSYALDPLTGVITFTPVAGYSGAPTAVKLQVLDAYGQTAIGSYQPIVKRPLAAAISNKPVLSNTGVDVAGLTRLGVLILLAGAVVLVGARFRRRESGT